MLVSLTVPPGAAWLASDLTDFRKAAIAVEPGRTIDLPDLPDDAYVEYGWLDAGRDYMADPAPAHPKADNPWYAHLLAIHGPQYRADPLALGADATDAGQLDRLAFESQRLGGQKRRAMLYTPPGLEPSQPLPVIYCHDGLAFRHHGHFTALVDRLIAAGEIAPLKVVLVQPVEREDEYPFNEAYLRFTLDELVPEVEARAGFVCNGQRAALGASLGGLFSAWLAWTAPDVFGHVLALSGAFITSPASRLDHRSGGEWLREQVRRTTRKPLRFDLFCGRLEWITDANRNLAAALTEQGYAVTYRERSAGHNWTNWRNAMPGLLRAAFGPDRED